MPQTITKTIYTFDELSDRAKERARDWFRELKNETWSPDDMEHVLYDAERMGTILGITMSHRTFKTMGGGTATEPEVTYDLSGRYGQTVGFSGLYSYAKGASKAIRAETNDAELIRIADELQKINRKYFYHLTATINARRDAGISVSISSRINDYIEPGDYPHDALEECITDFAAWIYKQLESEMEYMYSDEAIDESIEANQYTFDADGRRDD